MIKRVLVALDGSDHANKALDLAVRWRAGSVPSWSRYTSFSDKPLSDAERRMAEVEFQSEGAKDFILRPSIGAASDTRLESQQLIEQAAETRGRLRWALGERLRACLCTRQQKGRSDRSYGDASGRSGKEILSVAKEENADIIVMGRRGLGDLAGLLARQRLAQGDASRRVCLSDGQVKPSPYGREPWRSPRSAPQTNCSWRSG